MAQLENVQIDIGDITLHDAAHRPVPLASLSGVTVLVLMRHRH